METINALSITQLSNKYTALVSGDKFKFLEELKLAKSLLDPHAIAYAPALIYSSGIRNAICYYLGTYFSLKMNEILDYVVITGRQFVDQIFLPSDIRDHQLVDRVFNTGITFIILSQFDYNNQFLESTLIDLIESRTLDKKATIILYEITDSKTAHSLTKKIEDYFIANKLTIINLVGNALNAAVKPINPKPSMPATATDNTQKPKNKRIL